MDGHFIVKHNFTLNLSPKAGEFLPTLYRDVAGDTLFTIAL